ncbi:MAG: MBOAT family protein [Candidatus Wallbacteria bacterium]|nr:MBOAT family protein [Candidatus Wallbacteria bacterium]
MVFTTHLFVFYFLPLTLLVYYFEPKRLRTLTLVLVSYLFYAWASPAWALLMFFSTVVDYVCGLVLVRLSGLPDEDGQLAVLPRGEPRSPGQTIALAVSIASNVLLLGFFKYFDFAVANLNQLLDWTGNGSHALQFIHVALPVGISFYTFQSMSYAIDVYRGDARAMRSLVDFCCFETLYPHLVAGPIVRYSVLADQIRERSHSWEKFARGIAFFSCGMAKKILIANPLGAVADQMFGNSGLRCGDSWYGLFSYSFQIYFDFSGYSDMAVCLGLMIWFCLIKNFDSPYCADSITDFWRRWHISLSTWLRDYLYVPLGGNRLGPRRTYVNLMVVMLIGGLWHGASWNFVIWGAFHGFMLALERYQGKTSAYSRLPRSQRVGATFLLASLAWVFFRAETLGGALTYLAMLLGFCHPCAASPVRAVLVYTPFHLIVFTVAALLVWTAPQSWDFTRDLSRPKMGFLLALLAMSVSMMWTQSSNPFLYFRF